MTNGERPDCELTVGLRAGLINRLKAFRRILQLVLRGYLTGQPVGEERPRKGCC